MFISACDQHPPCESMNFLPPVGPLSVYYYPANGLKISAMLLSLVDCGHLVQAVLLGLQAKVGDAVGHVHSLG